MKGFFSQKIVLIFSLLILVAIAVMYFFREPKIDFNTQVKPIINKKCITCHGGVKAKAGFSMLFREEAMAPTKSGKPAIIPGDPDGSEFMRRITHKDPEERMPFKHEPLSADEVAIFRKWIKEGALWGEHWSYVPVQKVEVPDNNDDWIRNEIDQFIVSKLKEQDMTHSTEATKEILLRRVSLDLIGMPAPDSIAKKYLSDSTDKAYEVLVDDLLASKFYGEKWTTLWLDIARYADTRGYEADRSRTIWRYRDWVIDALNADKPYDAFLKEQMAGDLLPEPTDAQYIATAYHRNAMTNDEGGSDNEEFRTAAVMDRVNTTWTGLLGTTFACVQCHSHPYDPIKQEEYYKFLAFFNNSRDEDTEAEYPLLREYKTEDSLKLAELRKWLSTQVSEEKGKEYYTFLKTWQPTINSLQCDKFVNAALVSSWYAGIRNKGTCRLKNVVTDNKSQLQFRYVTYKPGATWTIYLDSLEGTVLKKIPLSNTKGEWKIETVDIPQVSGKHTLYFGYYNPSIQSPDETGVIFEWFRFADPFPGKDKPGYDSAFKHYNDILVAAPSLTTPILIENSTNLFRPTNIFERGNWLVKGKEVAADVPAVFNKIPESAPHNRYGLALWLTDKKNPLTARTMVNRLWEQLFGYGIVETLEDFGSQGISPTHRELLDWMSWQFMNEDNWSLKKSIRRMVLSATYRQQSIATKESLEKDPYNKWLGRGPRVRLSAEQIRDQALVVSGILSTKMYGPGVMPYQPPGIWSSPYNGDVWTQSKGEDQYRRAVYTYWKRSAAYPSTITFDAPGRQVCTARRIRTNTPLQALTLLNDSAYMDMARHFAYRLMSSPDKEINKKIANGFRLATGHDANPESLKALVKLYEKAYVKFKADKDNTCEVIGVMDEHNNPETAAMVMVTNALLNLDEVVTKY